MGKAVSKAVQPVVNERIVRRIVLLRGERVMLDVHLAELYEVETRVLKQAVRRNRVRFPEDFLFELTKEEATLMVSQVGARLSPRVGLCGPSARGTFGLWPSIANIDGITIRDTILPHLYGLQAQR